MADRDSRSIEAQVGGSPLAGGAIRVEYTGPGLSDDEMPDAPWPLVSRFLAEAVSDDAARGDASEPNTLDLATVDADGLPDVRPVLMKLLDPRGPAFISDAHSAKAQQLAANPVAAAALRWPRLYRVVRFRGPVEPLTREELLGLWVERPRGAQVAACTSLQSQPVASRAALEEMVREQNARVAAQVGDGPVPMPDAYVGWRVRPVVVEVWAGRESRLHDRVRYTASGDGALMDDAAAWTRTRLQP